MYKRYERYKDSGIKWIGEIPEHWELITLKRKFKVINGGTPKSEESTFWDDGNIVWVTPDDLSRNREMYINDSKRKITDKGIKHSSASLVPRNSLVISTRAPIGYVKIAGSNLSTNQGCKSLTSKSYDVDEVYYYYTLLYKKDYLNVMGQGTTFTELSSYNLANCPALLPPNVEQKAISNYLDSIDSEIDSLIADKKALIQKLEEYKQSIITEAVTKGLNSNVKMKDSGIEWIGEIPEHWEISRVKYQADVNKRTLTDKVSGDYEINYLDISNVDSNGKVINIEPMLFENAPSRARRVVSNGDTLVSTVRTYLKAITWFDIVDPNFICSTGFAVLSPKDSILPKYLSFLMRSTLYIEEIVSRSFGVSYPAITANEIANLECLLPSRDEQHDIIKFIDHQLAYIENLILDVEIQIQNLKSYRQSLIYEAVTGKIDVRDYQPERSEQLA